MVYNTKDLNHIIDSYNIINKKIESIFLTDDTTLYKDSMVTGYNNSNELSNLPNWKIMKRITEDMIPDKLERSNLAYINSPLVIVFDDTTTLELYLKGYSRAYISHNQLKEKYKYNFDIKNAFKKILNHKIIKYAIMKYSPEHSDCYYIDKRIKNNDNIWYITFYLDNEIELRFISDFERKDPENLDKMVHVSTFCVTGGLICMTYYANTKDPAEDPNNQTARFAYAPVSDPSQKVFLDLQTTGDQIGDKTVDMVYDTILMQNSMQRLSHI